MTSTFLAACASNPDNIKASYVSTIQYEKYDCDQIALETAHVERNVNDLYQNLKSKSDKDAWQMGVGLVLLWPVLFALEGGDGPEASEYARLKGEYEALRQVSIAKKCSITFKKDLSEVVKTKNPDDEKKPAKGKKKEKSNNRTEAKADQPAPEAIIAAEAAPASYVIASKSGAPAFTEPNASGEPVHTFGDGAKVTVLEAVEENRWYKVLIPDGRTAFVPSATIKELK